MSDEDRGRNITPCAAKDDLLLLHNLDDRIIGMPSNGAVMDEEEIGDPGEALEGFSFIGTDGFIGEVPAGGDKRQAEFAEKDMMEWGIGKHDAEGRETGSYFLRRYETGVGRSAAPSKQNDRSSGRLKDLCFCRRNLTDGANRLQGRIH